MALRPRGGGDDPLYLGLDVMLAAARGAVAAADEADRKLAAIEHPTLGSVVTLQRARIAAARGDRAEALSLLERAVERGIVRVPVGLDLHLDWVFDPLRGDPRFDTIARGLD